MHVDVRIGRVLRIRSGVAVADDLQIHRFTDRDERTARTHFRQLEQFALRQRERVVRIVLAVFRQMSRCVVVGDSDVGQRAVGGDMRKGTGRRVDADHGDVDLCVAPGIGLVDQVHADESGIDRIHLKAVGEDPVVGRDPRRSCDRGERAATEHGAGGEGAEWGEIRHGQLLASKPFLKISTPAGP